MTFQQIALAVVVINLLSLWAFLRWHGGQFSPGWAAAVVHSYLSPATTSAHRAGAGGGVIGVTAIGDTFSDAIDRVYEAARLIEFEGMQYRRNIGAKALAMLSYFGEPPPEKPDEPATLPGYFKGTLMRPGKDGDPVAGRSGGEPHEPRWQPGRLVAEFQDSEGKPIMIGSKRSG